MLPELENALREELKQLRVDDRYRDTATFSGTSRTDVRSAGRDLISFSSND